jgi:hypothetical protein
MDRGDLVKVLCFTYRRMVASEALLRFAIQHAEGELKAWYEQHLVEETGHDKMLLDDLKRLGVVDVPSSFLAAKLCGSQYYYIAHEHPAMLLGYMHAAESRTLPVEYVDYLSAKHGTELTCMRHHSEHDPGHASEIAEQIAKQPADVRLRIYQNEEQLRHLLETEFPC